MQEHVRQRVKELADGNVPLSGSLRVVCPICSSPNKTMSIQDTPTGLWFKCFRASCGVWGNVNAHYVRAPAKHVPRPISKLTIAPLPEHYLEQLPVKPKHPPRFDPVNRAVLYAVLSPTGVRRGWIARKYEWIAPVYGPKSKDYVELDTHPFCHYPMVVANGSLVLVEDIPSAERLSDYVQVCALIGTDVSLSFVEEWLDLGITKLIVALDADAPHKAAAIAAKWSGLFTIEIVNIDDDVKDMSDANFNQLVENLIGRSKTD